MSGACPSPNALQVAGRRVHLNNVTTLQVVKHRQDAIRDLRELTAPRQVPYLTASDLVRLREARRAPVGAACESLVSEAG
jgi:hypothetical protein